MVEGNEAKEAALRLLTEHIVRDRWEEIRPPNAKELKATMVLAIPLTEVSAKVRTGPPVDDEEDYSLPVWAGVLPLELNAGAPLADHLAQDVAVPEYLHGYRRKRAQEGEDA